MTVTDIFKDKNGKVVIAQRPNLPLIVWGVATVSGLFIKDGPGAVLLDLLATVGIITWALLEIFLGVNIFRRLLGAGFLLMMLGSRLLL